MRVKKKICVSCALEILYIFQWSLWFVLLHFMGRKRGNFNVVDSEIPAASDSKGH